MLGESKEYRTADTMLVRIAERPLVVAALFLFTALFPWVIYFLLPVLAKVTLLDLVQWLTLPILFVLVNGLILFLWMNHTKTSNTSTSSITSTTAKLFQHEDHIRALDEVFKRPTTIELPRPIELPKPAIQVELPPPVMNAEDPFSITSSISEGEEEEERQDKPPVAQERDEERPTSIKGHKKSKSLGGNVNLLDLKLTDLKPMDDLLQQQQSKANSGVSRRHSTPKSRLGDSGPTEKKTRVSRRNSSPKAVTPSTMKLDKEQVRSATMLGDSHYTPPVRVRQPEPLDKDDLNSRIENFLTKFKIERQESNLRAALKSSDI